MSSVNSHNDKQIDSHALKGDASLINSDSGDEEEWYNEEETETELMDIPTLTNPHFLTFAEISHLAMLRIGLSEHISH